MMKLKSIVQSVCIEVATGKVTMIPDKSLIDRNKPVKELEREIRIEALNVLYAAAQILQRELIELVEKENIDRWGF